MTDDAQQSPSEEDADAARAGRRPEQIERLAWIVGLIGCLSLASQLIGRPPLDETDRRFGDTIAAIQHEVRAGYVAPIDDAKLTQMQNAATAGLLSVLDPPYTVFVPPERVTEFNTMLNGTFVGIGVSISQDADGNVLVRTPFEGGPAYEAGIESGDVFVGVDGRNVVGLGVEELRSRIQGAAGTSVSVTVRRYDGELASFDIERRSVSTPTVSGWARNRDGSWDYLLDREAGVAYLYVSQFNEGTADAVAGALRQIEQQGARALVLDLRFDGGGRVEEATRIADFFLNDGVIVRTKGRARPEQVVRASRAGTLFTKPMAVLVNQDSASASEILAGALADHRRATVVGTRTFGKGSVQEVRNFEEAGELKMTVAQYFLPSGRSVQKVPGNDVWGVDPNIEIKLNDEELAQVYRTLTEPKVIPPRSHATTRPERPRDKQLDAAVDALAALMLSPPATRAAGK